MNSFMKAIKSTFSLIFDFINEVQELGCIDNSSLSFNFVTLNEDFAMISSYIKSLNKLLENLQELQNTTFQKSPIMNSSSNKGSEDEVVCSSYVPHEQNLQYSHSSSTEDSNEPYAKTVKYKGRINAYNACEIASRENIDASQFSKSEMSLFITEKETAKNYYPSLPSYQEGTLCSTSTLVAPFDNLALQNPINSGQSLGESVATSPYNSSSLNSDNAKSQNGASYSLSNLQTFKLTFKSNICKNSIDESKNFKKCNYQGRDVSFSDKEGSNTSSSKNKGGGRFRKKAGASFVCTVCGRNFKTQKHLSMHLKKMHDDGENSIFTNDVDMENGEKISLPVYCCRTCHLASSNLTNFKNHFCKTSNEDTNQVSNKVLITSLRKIQQLRKFICDTCGVEFRALKRILYHLPRCIPGPYQCNICSILFVSLKDLNYHKKKDHKDEKCFSCDECGKSFLRKASLRKHCINRHELLESMESKKPSSFKCDVCSKNFIKKIFLTNHKIRMHGLEKKFLCQVCGKKFMSNNSLMIHIDIHKGEKKFI
ncbi:Zinc finger protein [Armadillidium nasatum]|uniref:Zinc finger protein n=1 Tax=Armadillidium nasatum TaxID=96803 RepID=A0A5N5SNQ0_9CRUS|nr:Zinc finger protein [Armadillidium nasatum]